MREVLTVQGEKPLLRSQIQSLSLDQIEALGEALLDFTKPADLVNWLQENQAN